MVRKEEKKRMAAAGAAAEGYRRHLPAIADRGRMHGQTGNERSATTAPGCPLLCATAASARMGPVTPCLPATSRPASLLASILQREEEGNWLVSVAWPARMAGWSTWLACGHCWAKGGTGHSGWPRAVAETPRLERYAPGIYVPCESGASAALTDSEPNTHDHQPLRPQDALLAGSSHLLQALGLCKVCASLRLRVLEI